MAERNERVLERVREELNKDPGLGSRKLHEMAQKMDPEIGNATLQQFHARYVLPIKREQAARRKEGAPRKARGKGGKRRAEAAAPAETARSPRPGRPRGSRKQRQQQEALAAQRERVRGVFLQFAREFADAESPSEIVQVLSKIDEYVDRVTSAG